ncbi:hypothetical protein BH09BAC5_BH09BAC5_27950 [soil metagenome]
MEARWFGSTPDNSKIHIHEAGHYLGLYHTFEGGCVNNNCQTDGDRVCDTPPDNSTAAVYCSVAPNSCNTDDNDLSLNNPFRPIAQGGMGDQPDMIQNYMDYGYQNCQIYLTTGQKNRMVAALTTTRSSLLSSIGCNSLCTNPITIGFNMSASVILTGGTVTCTNTTTPASNYTWQVNNVPSGITTNFSYLFANPGTYTITLIATNGDPACDKTINQIVTVNCQAQASFTMSPAGPYSPGDSISFTNTSTGASNYHWVMDGISQGTTTNFGYRFNTAGGHYVYLISDNGSCSDTSTTHFFQIGNCYQTHMADNWYFDRSSINFSSGNPIVGTSAITSTSLECSSTISDVNGNLLFYTDGNSVWDKNSVLMPNGTGLMGHYSASQGVLITPDPSSTNRYYIFTTGAIETSYSEGLRYSIVDMTLNSGLGNVTATKNILLQSTMGEKLTATWHSNGTDIWLATHSPTGNTFYAFLITPTGINPSPVITTLGSSCDMGLGNLMFSHDGNHIAACLFPYNPPRYIVYAEFNKTTGVFSNSMEILVSTGWEQAMSIEFSPDNSKLYSSGWNGTRIYQWDLSAGNIVAINASKTTLDPYTGGWTFGRIKLAPNGIIYVQANGNTLLDAILSPNLLGLACNYTQTYGPAMLVNNAGFALPNMLQGLITFRVPKISGPDTICSGHQTYNYLLANSSTSDSAVWWHLGNGNLLSTTDTSATLVSGNNSGDDTLIVTYFGQCGVTRDTMIIHTSTSPNISLGNDTAFCGNIILSPGTGFASYLWQNNSTANSFTATTTGTFWVQVTNANGCSDRDSIVISANPNLPPVNLGSDITVCLGHTAILNAGNNYSTYTWPDGSHNSTFTAYWPGTYWVNVTGPCYSGTDTIKVIGDESGIPLDLGNDTAVCNNAFPFTVNAPGGYLSYLWSDGSTLSTFSITGIGQFYVTVTDSAGCSARDTINVTNCVAVDEIQNSGLITIFPNPSDQFITIDYSGYDNPAICIYTAAGQIVFSKKVNDASSSSEISTTDFSEGMYIIEIKFDGNIIHKKFLILHN